MKTYKFVFVGILLSIIFLLVLPHGVNAKGDTVYITPNNIPAPAAIGGFVTYQIYGDTLGASPSSGINAWDLVVTDNDPGFANLNPVNISITGNLLTPFGTLNSLINCVNGGAGIAPNQPGNIGCTSTKDGPGIVHTAVGLLAPATPTPVSGLIAKIVYSVTGLGNTAVNVQPNTTTGCTPDPLTGNPNPCDTLSDGTGTPVPHSTKGATYGTPTTPDFSISAPNGTAPAPINPGGSGSAKVNITSLTGLTGPITVTQTIYPANGLTFSCGAPTPNPIMAGGTSTFVCPFNSNVPAGYVVTLNVTIGATTHLAPITIPVGDFSFTGPSSTVNLPGTTSATVTAGSVNGFTGTVNIGRIIPIAVPDFTITTTLGLGSPPGSATSTITVDPGTLGFSGTVALSDNVPPGLSCQPLSKLSVTVPPRDASTILTCTSSTAGVFEVTISGTSGVVTHTTSAVFIFSTRTSFSVSAASPDTGSTGDLLTSTISVVSYFKFNGTLQLSDTVPAGLNCRAISLSSVTFPLPPVPPGTYIAKPTLSCTSQTVGTYPVTITATNGTSTQTSIATFNFKNLLTASCPNSVNVPAGGSVSATCNFTASLSGNYVVKLTGNYSFAGGSVTHTATINVRVAGPALTSPSPVSIGAGYVQSLTVTVTPKLGFTGTVTMTSSINATAITVTCSLTTLTFSGATPQNTICSLPGLRPGHYAVTVTGTSGPVSNTAIIIVNTTPDFTITATAVTISPGTTGSSSVTVTSYGIIGVVGLTYSVPSGLTCPNAPASATPNATVMLGCSASTVGTFNVTVTGTALSGALTHNAVASFTTGPDIAVTKVTVSTTTASVGDKVTVTVTIKYNGTGSNFQIQVRWGQITVAKQNFTISGPGPTDFNVVWDTSGFSPGNATISAVVPLLTSGSYTESTPNDNIANGPSLMLQPAASSSLLSGATLYVVIGVIVAAGAGAAAFLFLRRRKPVKATP